MTCRSKEVRQSVHLIIISDLNVGVSTELWEFVRVLQASWDVQCTHKVGIVVALLVGKSHQVFSGQTWSFPCCEFDRSVCLFKGFVGVEVEVKVTSIFVPFNDNCACLWIFYDKLLVLILRSIIKLHFVLPFDCNIGNGRIVISHSGLFSNFSHGWLNLLKFLGDVIILHVCLVFFPVYDDSIRREFVVDDVILGPIHGESFKVDLVVVL